MSRRAAALAACVAGALALPGAAVADGDVGVSMTAVGQQSYFKLFTGRGRAVHGRVRLANLTAVRKRVVLRRIDVGVAQAGGLAYGLGRARHEGRWLRLRRHVVVLAPHGVATVAFSARPPRRASRGDHYAAIAATVSGARHAGARASGSGLRFVTRLAIAVRVRLAGRRRAHLHVGRAHVTLRRRRALVVPLANRGTGMLEGAQVHLVVHRGRHRVLRVRQRLGAFVPHHGLRLAVRWPSTLPYGRYRLTGWVGHGRRRIHVHQRLHVRLRWR